MGRDGDGICSQASAEASERQAGSQKALRTQPSPPMFQQQNDTKRKSETKYGQRSFQRNGDLNQPHSTSEDSNQVLEYKKKSRSKNSFSTE